MSWKSFVKKRRRTKEDTNESRTKWPASPRCHDCSGQPATYRRLVRAAYIIPWYIWMGKYKYKPMVFFTMATISMLTLILTAGVPAVVALAKYTPGTSHHSFCFLSGLKFMGILGLGFKLFSCIFYLPSLWVFQGGKSWFRSCIFLGCLWSFLSMSVIRGFFRFNNMKPTL